MNTLFPARQDWAVDVGELNSEVKDTIRTINKYVSLIAFGVDVLTLDVLLLPSEINFLQAINRTYLTDTYPTPHAASELDGVNVATRLPASALTQDIGYIVDNKQPFPIYGWMRVEWERHPGG